VGTIDVRTGVALTAAATFAVAAVTDFMGRTGEAMAVGKPVGVAPYAYWQWAGDGSALDDGFNPSAYRNHNHNLQHRVAILCDYVLEVPLVPGATAAEAKLNTAETNASNVSVFTALANLPVAKSTVRTPITFGGATGANFVNEVALASDIAAAGDWAIDLTTGVVSVFAAAAINADDSLTITYSHYAAAPTAVSVFASAVGNLKAGDFVIIDANSNYQIATTESFQDIVGQVLEVESAEKDALGMVKTAYNPPLGTDSSGSSPGYAGQMDQMPGSATGGVSDKVHYAGAADLVVRINLVSR
jgi:hypothetical protein